MVLWLEVKLGIFCYPFQNNAVFSYLMKAIIKLIWRPMVPHIIQLLVKNFNYFSKKCSKWLHPIIFWVFQTKLKLYWRVQMEVFPVCLDSLNPWNLSNVLALRIPLIKSIFKACVEVCSVFLALSSPVQCNK